MPVLEALGRLCREPGGEPLLALLHRYAPTWLVQLPTLLTASELETLQRKVQGATRERMLREMGEAVDALTSEGPLVLWLEDLHWSDPSTLELLALLARRREPARLFIIGTYRPVDVIVNEHPLRTMKQELQLHGQCHELAVRLLREEAVEEYPTLRVDADGGARRTAPLQPLARTIHQRTEGNPLFMANVVDELLTQGKADNTTVEVSTPASIRAMIERQLERLSTEEQRVLEAASVAGIEFSAAAVAAGVEIAVAESEDCCARLARRGQFLQSRGSMEWPDGAVAARYRFLHALYQEVTYERIPAGRRVTLHRWIGERLEAAYGAQGSEVAAELAVHFERGHDSQRAVQYLEQAGKNAVQRSAQQEAINYFAKGLELLKAQPDTPARIQQEVALQTILGSARMATKGYAAPEVERAYGRARELCQQMEDTSQLFPVLWGLAQFSLVRGEYQTAHDLGERLLRLAQYQQDPAFLLEAQRILGGTLLLLGELVPARTHVEQGVNLYNLQQHSSHAFLYSHDPAVVCLTIAATALWHLGYPDQALQKVHEALTLAQELAHPFSLAWALAYAAIIHQYRREGRLVQEQAEATITLCADQGFPLWLASGMYLRGWALTEQGQSEEGIAQIRQGISAYLATGAELARSYQFVVLAEAYAKGGQREKGLSALAEARAVIDKIGERLYEPELYRLKGELTLQSHVQSPRSGRIFPEGYRSCAQTEREVMRTPCLNEPRAPVATTG